MALLEFACGALGTVDTFFCIPDGGSRNALELHGSMGSILAEGTIRQGPKGQDGRHPKESAGGYDSGSAQRRRQHGHLSRALSIYRAEIESFSSSVLDGRAPEVGAGGWRSQPEVLTACYESARTGRAIVV